MYGVFSGKFVYFHGALFFFVFMFLSFVRVVVVIDGSQSLDAFPVLVWHVTPLIIG